MDYTQFHDRFPEAPDWALALYEKESCTFNEVSNIKERLCRAEDDAGVARNLADDAKQIAYEARDHAEELEDRVKKLENENKQLKDRVRSMEDYTRRENLKIDGIEEGADETLMQLIGKVQNLFKDLGIEDLESIRIDRCHRLGRKGSDAGSRPRTVIIRFNWSADRTRVWEKRNILFKNKSKIFIREDFSKETEEARKTLYPYAKSAKIANLKHTFKGNKLLIDGKMYSADNLEAIPAELHPSSNATREQGDKVIFHGSSSIFSNFHNAPFKVQGTTYNSSEQFYQHKKAEHFHDDITADKIKRQKDPLQCMILGKKVKGYSETEWLKVDRKYMHQANLAKFSQNKQLCDALIATGDKILAESSKDMYWGTGTPITSPNAFGEWIGLNFHGKGLMLIRETLRHQ